MGEIRNNEFQYFISRVKNMSFHSIFIYLRRYLNALLGPLLLTVLNVIF
jgi:hypothetical protein